LAKQDSDLNKKTTPSIRGNTIMALEPGRRSPPSKIAKRGKGLTKPCHLGTRPIYFKRSQKGRIIQARYRPLKPRYVPTNNVPKI
jgi:hypothetical protein